MNFKYLLAFLIFNSVGTKCFCFQANNNIPSKSNVIELLDSIELAIEQIDDTLTINLINRALKICESLNEDSLRAEILLYKSNYLLDRQEKEEGLKLLFDYIKIHEELVNLIKVANGYYKLTAYYYWNNDFERALEYAKLTLVTHPDTKHNQNNIAKSHMVIGTILQELDKLDESMHYQNKALEIKRELKFNSDIPISLSNMAHTNLKLGDTILAIKQFKEAVQIADSLELTKDINFGTYSLGCVYYEIGNYDESKVALENVVIEWERLNSQKDLLKAYPMMAKVYKNLFLFKKANQSLNKFILLKNKAFDETKIGFQEELEKKYKTEKKELENLKLKISNETYKKKVGIYSIIALIFSIVTILLSLFYFQIRKVKVKLADQYFIIQGQNKQLTKLNQLKSRFFTNVTHELRTPLTLMLGPIGSVIKSEQLSFKNSTLLKMAQKNGKSLINLVSEILDLSKMEAGKLPLNEEPALIFSLLSGLFEKYESFALQKGIRLSFQYEANKKLILLLDINKFEKIYTNLLSNAFKFTVENDDISILFNEDEDNVHLIISDTGQGIHENDVEHVFELYYQSKQPDAIIQGGTGIGLSLCFEYVKLHGGEISVQSIYGEQTTFTVKLPKKELSSIADIEPTNYEIENGFELIKYDTILPPIEPKNIKGRILVVEDNLDLANYLKVVLSDYYIVEIAENGRKAIQLLEQESSLSIKSVNNRFDLIVSDIMMPVMDGFELLKALKSNNSWNGIPVIMLTAKSDLQDKLTALRIGVDDYILKPFVEEELLARIDNLISHFKVRILQNENNNSEEFTGGKSIEEVKWLNKLEIFTLKRLGDFNLTADVIAQEMFLSRSQFFRKMKSLVGMTPTQYVKEVRFNQARIMLEDKTYSNVKNVVFAVGFKQVKYFSQEFKKRFGKSPSEYLK